LRAAIYVRVSTEEQAREGFSISAQKSECLKHVDLKKYDLYDIYIDDGYSAKDMKRPALQRMVGDMEKRLIDIVIFWRLDRLTRSVKDKSVIFEKFEKYNIDFKSIKEEYDTTTAAGRMVLNIMVSIAQGERETIGERVYMGMEHKVLTGKRNGAIAPIGYDWIDGKLIPNQEADFVRRLFKMYQNNHGIQKIAEKLNEEGKPFNVTTIHYILTNHQYCGKNRWNWRSKGQRTHKEIITDGEHEPIISEEEFDRVQEIMNRRKKRGKAATSDFPFTGIMKCGKCGADMVGASRQQKQRRYKFYRCSGNVNYGNKCGMPRVSEVAVTNAFLEHLQKLRKRDWARLIKITETKKEQSDTEKIERELQTIAKRKKRWQLAFANELISMEEFRNLTDEDRKLEQQLKAQLVGVNQSDNIRKLSKDEAIELLLNLPNIWHFVGDDVARKEFVSVLFARIVVDTDEKPRPHNADELKLNLSFTVH